MPDVCTDSPEQAAADQLARLREEVASLRRQLSQAQRLATVGTMTTMVAHEFNNILTPIINYAQLAQQNPALADKAIARAAEGGQRASTICQAILGLARGDAAPARANVRELVRQTLEAMARDPHKDRIELSVDIPEHLEVTVRRAELQQAVLNLVLNARAAVLPKSGPRRIAITAAAQEGEVRIDVADNGVGIAPENLERIFQPFFTTRQDAPDAQQGHGLGLAFCRETIAAMNGRIGVASTVGAGSVFTVYLPRQV